MVIVVDLTTVSCILKSEQFFRLIFTKIGRCKLAPTFGLAWHIYVICAAKYGVAWRTVQSSIFVVHIESIVIEVRNVWLIEMLVQVNLRLHGMCLIS